MQKILRILNNTALLLLGRFHEIPLADLYAGAIFWGSVLLFILAILAALVSIGCDVRPLIPDCP